tara:strand:- start:135 stop:467 length:333 start_codon:yes stop_codon:yes gene_type:complete
MEVSILDAENSLLEIHKKSVLGVREDFSIKPMVRLSEGEYSLVCQSKEIGSQHLNQTILPFKVSKVSKQGEVYVLMGELEFKFNVAERKSKTDAPNLISGILYGGRLISL